MNFKISIRERKPRKSEKVCRTTPWPFGEISMDPLGYWWFYLLIDVSKVIGGDSEVIGEFDEEFRASWWVFPSNLIGGLRSRCRVAVHLNALIWQSFCGIVLVPSLPYEKGVQSFWKDYFATASDSPVIIIPDLYSRHALTKKVSRGCLPFSLTGFILYIYFPIIM